MTDTIQKRLKYAEYVDRTVKLLLEQFLITFGSVLLVMFSQTLFDIVLFNIGMFVLLSLAGTVCTLFYMSFNPKTETQVYVFTMFQTLGICALVVVNGRDVILFSLLIILGVILGLLILLKNNMFDFDSSTTSDTLMFFLMLTLLMGFSNIFLNIELLRTVELYFGTVLFLIYIVVDIKNFLSKAVKADDNLHSAHIDAVLNIYLDVINVFIRLVQIITRIKKAKNTK